MTARSDNVAPKPFTSGLSTHGVPNTHTSSVRGTDFTIDSRYRVQKFVGCGSYGVVCAALDTRDNVRPRLSPTEWPPVRPGGGQTRVWLGWPVTPSARAMARRARSSLELDRGPRLARPLRIAEHVRDQEDLQRLQERHDRQAHAARDQAAAAL
eukprot:5210894-Prymnesium_polylepis.1